MNNPPLAKHRRRHIELHQWFDELLADYMGHQVRYGKGRMPARFGLEAPISDLMKWSFEQTQNPTDSEHHMETSLMLELTRQKIRSVCATVNQEWEILFECGHSETVPNYPPAAETWCPTCVKQAFDKKKAEWERARDAH